MSAQDPSPWGGPPPRLPREPLFGRVPVVLLVLGGLIALYSAAILTAPAALSDRLLELTAVLTGPTAADPRPELVSVLSLGLHSFAHGGWGHLALNLAAFLVFGAGAMLGLGRGLAASAAFLVLFFGAAAMGALAEIAWRGDDQALVVGASSGVSGLIAAAAYVYRARGERLPAPWSADYLMGVAPWALLNVVVGITGGVAPGLGQIAWMAHLGGMAGGMVLYPLLILSLRQAQNSGS